MKKITVIVIGFIMYLCNVHAYSYDWYGRAALNNGSNEEDYTLFDNGYAYLIRVNNNKLEVSEDLTINKGKVVDSTEIQNGSYSGSLMTGAASDVEDYLFAVLVTTEGREGLMLPSAGYYGLSEGFYKFDANGKMEIKETIFANKMVALPEPTSAMMILVGLAAVALRRAVK